MPNLKPTTKPEYLKRKRQILLTDIGGEWYVNKMRNPKPTTKNPRPDKKEQEKEKRKFQLKVALDHFKYWEFQIYW